MEISATLLACLIGVMLRLVLLHQFLEKICGKNERAEQRRGWEAWWWSSGSSKEGDGTDWLLMSSLRRHSEASSQTPITVKTSPPLDMILCRKAKGVRGSSAKPLRLKGG